MKKEDIFEAIGQADEDLLARSETQKKVRRWKGPVISAACLGVVCLGGLSLFGGMGGSSGGNNISNTLLNSLGFLFHLGGSSSSSGHEQGTAYDFYDGPILPLTLTEENSSITATRSLTLDFSPYQKSTYLDANGNSYERAFSGLIAHDNYTLTNGSNADITVTALYPFAENFYAVDGYSAFPYDYIPAITVDGVETTTALYVGSTADGWLTAQNSLSEEGLAHEATWESYQALLSDGSYLNHTLAPTGELEQLVIVYEFTDISAPEEIAELTEYYDLGVFLPSRADSPDIQVLTTSFNSLDTDDETDQRRLGSSIRAAGEDNAITTVAFLGGDLEFSTRGYYYDDETNKDVYFDDLEVTVTRTEMTLSQHLALTLDNCFYSSTFLPTYSHEGGLYSDLFYQAVVDYCTSCGTEAYALADMDILWLEELFEFCYHESRVFYLSFEVTIPAGESVTVETRQYKEGSYDYHSSSRGSEDLKGYDTLTTTGSSLTFTEQSAALEGWEFIEIGRQNYGFDPENGITSVSLDLNEPWYYLEVRKAAE